MWPTVLLIIEAFIRVTSIIREKAGLPQGQEHAFICLKFKFLRCRTVS